VSATEAARQFAADERRRAAAAALAATRTWDSIDPNRIRSSWSDLVPNATAVVTAGQQVAATEGTRYVTDSVIAQGADPDPAAAVRPGQLAGVASDGRPLETLLAVPATQTLDAIVDHGVPAQDALAQGRRRLAMLAATQVLDAGRIGASLGLVNDRSVTGYIRQLSPPSCSRCAVLAGRWYGWNNGFARHPNCDCVHVPATGADTSGLQTFDTDAYFNSLDQAQQDRIFTKAGAEAVRDGADIGQVVNARRGMRTTSAYGRRISVTTEGTSPGAVGRRAIEATAQRPGTRQVRLMPEQIYADANGDRDLTIRLLRRFGYLS
jgi:hypothetical protein